MTGEEAERSLASLQTTHDDLATANADLVSRHEALAADHGAASSSVDKLQAEASSLRKECDEISARLEAALRKGDALEKRRGALQEENGELVKQLEEVRARVVSVMEEKMELAASLESLETRTKAWERERLESESGDRLQSSQQAERIRSLEASLHAAESRIYELCRQPSTPKSLFISNDTVSPKPSPRLGVDALLPAVVRHKRQVSLSALKARMEPARPARRPMERLSEDVPEELISLPPKQFGDEIMYCCPACEGDLITI